MSDEGKAVWREGVTSLAVGGSRGCGRRLGRWLRPLGPVVLVGVAGLLVGWLVPQVRLAGTPRLTVDPADLDFGDKWEGERFSWKLSIRNEGSTPVQVEDFITSCDCVKVTPNTFMVFPGQVQQLIVTIDLKPFSGPYQGDLINRRACDITLIPCLANLSQHRWEWHLHGTAQRLLFIEDLPETLGPLDRGQSWRHHFRVRSAIPLESLVCQVDPPVVTAQVTGQGQDFAVQLLAPPGLPSGLLPLTVRLQPQKSGQRLPDSLAQVAVLVQEVVEVLPNPLQLGIVSVGDVIPCRLWVNPHHQLFQLIAVQTDGSGLTVERWQAEGDRWLVELKQHVQQVGPGQSSGRLRLILTSGGTLETEFQVRWYGVATLSSGSVRRQS